VESIYFAQGYPDELAQDMLIEAGINFRFMPHEPE
jgi:dCMP deaminase